MGLRGLGVPRPQDEPARVQVQGEDRKGGGSHTRKPSFRFHLPRGLTATASVLAFRWHLLSGLSAPGAQAGLTGSAQRPGRLCLSGVLVELPGA